MMPASCPISSASRRSGVSARRFRKPVSMSIATFVPGAVGGEQRALDERDRQREVQVRVGREAGQARRRVERRGVDRQQQQREGQRRDDHRRLTQRAHHRAAREHADLDGERGAAQAATGRSAPARRPARPRPAPSSERPVFARKTSSSVGRVQLQVLHADALGVERRARPRPAGPRRCDRRTAAPLGEESAGSPKRVSTSRVRVQVAGLGGDHLDRRAGRSRP